MGKLGLRIAVFQDFHAYLRGNLLISDFYFMFGLFGLFEFLLQFFFFPKKDLINIGQVLAFLREVLYLFSLLVKDLCILFLQDAYSFLKLLDQTHIRGFLFLQLGIALQKHDQLAADLIASQLSEIELNSLQLNQVTSKLGIIVFLLEIELAMSAQPFDQRIFQLDLFVFYLSVLLLVIMDDRGVRTIQFLYLSLMQQFILFNVFFELGSFFKLEVNALYFHPCLLLFELALQLFGLLLFYLDLIHEFLPFFGMLSLKRTEVMGELLAFSFFVDEQLLYCSQFVFFYFQFLREVFVFVGKLSDIFLKDQSLLLQVYYLLLFLFQFLSQSLLLILNKHQVIFHLYPFQAKLALFFLSFYTILLQHFLTFFQQAYLSLVLLQSMNEKAYSFLHDPHIFLQLNIALMVLLFKLAHSSLWLPVQVHNFMF